MDSDKSKVFDFLKRHHMAVIATHDSLDSAPESALIAFAEDDTLTLYFQTGAHTRKAAKLATNQRVSLIIGLDLPEMATLQYEKPAKSLALRCSTPKS